MLLLLICLVGLPLSNTIWSIRPAYHDDLQLNLSQQHQSDAAIGYELSDFDDLAPVQMSHIEQVDTASQNPSIPVPIKLEPVARTKVVSTTPQKLPSHSPIEKYSYKSLRIDSARIKGYTQLKVKDPLSWLLHCTAEGSHSVEHHSKCPTTVQGRATELKVYKRDIDSDGIDDRLVLDRCCSNGGMQLVYSFLNNGDHYYYLGVKPFLGMGANSAYLPQQLWFSTLELATTLNALPPRFLDKDIIEDKMLVAPLIYLPPLEWLKKCATPNAEERCPDSVQNRPTELLVRRVEINDDEAMDWIVVDRCCGNHGAQLTYTFVQGTLGVRYLGASPYVGATAASVYRETTEF